MATELGTAYVSIVAETSKLEAGIKQALAGGSKAADLAGSDIGKRISASASKAMKDGWRPDQDIMAGIPDTKLDRIGARIGQVIGKGIAGGLRAREAGAQFGHSFAEGAGSIGLGRVIAGWKSELSGGGAINTMGMLAGKAFSAAFTLAAGGVVAGLGLALTKGFQRLESIDTAKFKLQGLGKTAAEIKDIVKTVTDVVTGTPYSLDEAFAVATQGIAGNVKDIKGYMSAVADAAGFASVPLERIGLVFQQVVAKGKADGEDLRQLMEAGLPIQQWLNDTGAMKDGLVTLDEVIGAIEGHAGGMAQKVGDSLKGALDNMQTAVARVGADLLTAIFGGESGDPAEGMKDSIKRITDMLNNLDNWIRAHREDIRQFFESAKEAASKLVEVLGKILGYLKDHPAAIQAVVVAFAAWEGIKGITMVASAIGALNGALGATAGLAGAALAPLAAIAAILAGGALGGASLDSAINAVGPNSEAGKNILNQEFAPGMGVPGATRDPIFQTGPDIPGGGGAGAQRERRGAGALDPTGGLLSGTVAPSALITGPVGNDPVERWRPLVRQQLATYGPQLGITNLSAWENKMMTQIRTESGGNPGAINNWDSNAAAGHPSQGLLQFIPSTFAANNISGGNFTDPAAQIAAFLPYVKNRYGVDRNGSPLFVGQGHGYAKGGAVDTVPAMLSPGEHVLTSSDVQAMGGQSGVYSFRKALHFADGGAVKKLEDMRTKGAIPAGAGSTAEAGTSGVAQAIAMGGDIINGLIDQAASAAATAISAAATAGSFGAGGQAAGPAASFAIGLGANAAKRGVKYGFQMGGIGVDALLQQLTPFGMPRWLTQDYTGFVPQQAIAGALGDVLSGGAQKAAGGQAPGGIGSSASAMPGSDKPGGPISNFLGTLSPKNIDPATTQHGQTQGAPPGTGLFENSSNSFLSTELAQPEAQTPGVQPMFKVDNIYTTDAHGVGEELSKRGRLAQMQYATRPGP